jgi:2-O-methyltransferase
VPINVMSISTRDIFTDNYFFLVEKPEVVEKALAEKPPFDGSNRKVVAVMTYRNSPQFAFRINDSFYSINNERCRLALDGRSIGMVDIYGRGWPEGLSLGDTRDDHVAGKPALLKPYYFNLCSENTIAPGYVTEKIWESVANGCLPIYHAGKGHSVYADFQEGSFIDTADYRDPSQLWDYIRKITPEEYYNRFQLCYDALVWAMARSRGEPGGGTLRSLRERLEIILRPEASFLRQRLRFLARPRPNWHRILGKMKPVILDIGANDGGTSFMFHQLFPEARLFGFEPDPRALERFKQRLLRFPTFAQRCMVFTCAVGNADGKLTFHMSGGQNPDAAAASICPGEWDLSGSLCKPKEHLKDNPWCTFDKTVTVDSVRLDTWSNQVGRGLIDLIWADVRGAEGMLIEGARETLSRTRFFHTEYHNREVYEGQPGLRQILALLPDFEVLADYGSDVLLVNKKLS